MTGRDGVQDETIGHQESDIYRMGILTISNQKSYHNHITNPDPKQQKKLQSHFSLLGSIFKDIMTYIMNNNGQA